MLESIQIDSQYNLIVFGHLDVVESSLIDQITDKSRHRATRLNGSCKRLRGESSHLEE